MNKAARNERIKITATWFNGAAVAALAVGCFAPIVAYVTSSTHVPLGDLNLLVAGWLALSVSLHFAARIVLRRIEE
jgi:hypothetical protein